MQIANGSDTASEQGRLLDRAPVNRRSLGVAALILSFMTPLQTLAETPGPSQQPGLVEYVNPKQGYRIDRPSSWEQTSKAGADVLFADPAKKSTTIGVTVSPIKIAGLEQFGDVETVRKKLMNTEKQKESTKEVTLVQESSRKGKSGTLIYDIEYELDSTRGRKRILSSVGIAQKKLFIVNGNLKCDASGCTDSDGRDIAVLRQVASTFDII
ncbi:hypothetical protein WJX82_003799 [Trebouxia sp. C0006]